MPSDWLLEWDPYPSGFFEGREVIPFVFASLVQLIMITTISDNVEAFVQGWYTV